MTRQRWASQRRGMTLLEVMIVIHLMGVVLAMAAMTLAAAFAAERSGRERAAATHGLGRLSLTFREDVHEARAWSLLPDAATAGDGLTLDLPVDRRATYTVRDGFVERLEFDGDRRIARETFRFPKGRTARFEIREQSPLVTCALVWLRQGMPPRDGPVAVAGVQP